LIQNVVENFYLYNLVHSITNNCINKTLNSTATFVALARENKNKQVIYIIGMEAVIEKLNAVEISDSESKLNFLKTIRHEIKKRRLIFDEGKDKFGMNEMTQLVKVKNTSDIKGYPFRAQIRDVDLALKVVPLEVKYEKFEHPSCIEHIVLKHLTDNIVLKNISPHVAFFLGTQKVGNKSRALKHLNLKRLEVEGQIRTHSNMLISEYVRGGSLDNWIFNTYEND
jgi:hypothetical protein